MRLGEFLKKEVVEKMRDLVQPVETSAEQKARLEKYRTYYFRDTDEMVAYLKRGGTIVPTLFNAQYKEGFTMNGDGKIVKTEMMYTFFGTPLCIRKDEYSVEEFARLECFNCKDEGYVMFWRKDENEGKN